jgi:hypothetical protein
MVDVKNTINNAYEKIRSLLVLSGGIAILLLWFNLMGGQVHVIETLIGVALSVGTGIYLHFKLPKILIGADLAE